jgi:hypothetical protein
MYSGEKGRRGQLKKRSVKTPQKNGIVSLSTSIFAEYTRGHQMTGIGR